jgi:hypothetical protein
VVARQLNPNNSAPTGDKIKWLKCAACGTGSVFYSDGIWPNDRPLRTPAGLPPIDKAIWEQVRDCLSVGAYVAAVMLCRKLLFHIAVAHGLPPEDKKGWAPTFAAAVEHLEGEGVISAKMRPWVDRIKDVGNDANHEVTPVDRDSALKVATFTEQLLRLAYEFDAEMAEVDPAGAESLAADE